MNRYFGFAVWPVLQFSILTRAVVGDIRWRPPGWAEGMRAGVKKRPVLSGFTFLVLVVLLVGGAKGFIAGVEGVSKVLGISALLLSLIIIPIATELPEKVNSIIWARRGKDTLAFGNITGAMVFQGTLLPGIGIMLTPWEPRVEVMTGVFITLAAAAWLRFNAKKGGVVLWALLVNGGLYALYLLLTLGR